MLLVLLACTENNISAFTPQLTLDPDEVAFGDVREGETATADVVVANGGRSRLEITAIESSDPALWTTDLEPVTLGPGDAQAFGVTHFGTGAESIEGWILLTSNDPDTSATYLPLSAGLWPPEVEIISPEDGDGAASREVVRFVGQASDPDHPSDWLRARWSSDIDGELWTQDVSGDGSVEYANNWLSAGVHQIELEVTDPAGNVATDSIELSVCAWATPQDFNAADDISGWIVEGAGAWDDGGWLELTGLGQHARGGIFNGTGAVDTADLELSLRFATGGGDGPDGADGMSITVARADSPSFLGNAGGCLGYAAHDGCSPDSGEPIQGLHIEFDTFYNNWDPTGNDHVAVHLNGDATDDRAWASLEDLEDNDWRELTLIVQAPRVKVWVDGTLKIDEDISGLEPFEGFVGFTAGSGDAVNYHRIDEVDVVSTCELPEE